MKSLTLLLSLFACTNCFSDTIEKWIDESGQVHYGDNPPSDAPGQIERLEFDDSFDPVAYEQAKKRNAELYREIDLIEKQQQAREKIAEKDLQKYFDQLDKKAKEIEREKLNKRKSRETERNRASIKLKRSSASEQPAKSAVKKSRYGM